MPFENKKINENNESNLLEKLGIVEKGGEKTELGMEISDSINQEEN